MSGIGLRLNMLLAEHDEIAAQSPLEAARSVAQEISDTERRLGELKSGLASAVDRICGDLAMLVRRLKPGLNVALDRSGCKVGYRTKTLSFTPDLKLGMWEVHSPNSRFLSKFRRDFGRRLTLSPDPLPVAQAVVDFFTDHYMTLGEQIGDNGLLYINNRPATGIQLMEWRLRGQHPQIPARLPRRHHI